MKRLHIALFLTLSAFAQTPNPGGSTNLQPLGPEFLCKTTTPSLIIWTGQGPACIQVDSSLVINLTTGVLSAVAPAPPPPSLSSIGTWQKETINLSAQAANITTTTDANNVQHSILAYTPLKQPVNMWPILFSYNISGIIVPPQTPSPGVTQMVFQAFGNAPYTGSPIQIYLPVNWQTSDTVTIGYFFVPSAN